MCSISARARLALACIIPLLTAFSSAQSLTTIHGGRVSGHWTLAGSPYRVVGTIHVSTLVIDPGVRVEMESGVQIRVDTKLTALGTAARTILFTAANPNKYWAGILFENTQPGSRLSHCRIEGSDTSAVRVVNSAPVIDHCTFTNNVAPTGAALHFTVTGYHLTLSHCVIVANRCTGRYPAVYADINYGSLALHDCTIALNRDDHPDNTFGGGFFGTGNGSFDFRDCRISHNRSTTLKYKYSGNGYGFGGGVYIEHGVASFSGCRITHNEVLSETNLTHTTGAHGGGLALHAPTTMTNCVIAHNLAQATADLGEARAVGAGVLIDARVTLKNCIIASNEARPITNPNSPWGATKVIGSGINVRSGPVEITNCTVAHNSHEGLHVSGGSTLLRNSIVFHNRDLGAQIKGTTTATYCDVQGWTADPKRGIINADPRFAGVGTEIILPASPCVDSGDPAAAYQDVCFPPSLGTKRNDMGAHGGPAACPGGPAMLTGTGNRTPGSTESLSLYSFGEPGIAYQLASSLGAGPSMLGYGVIDLDPDWLLIASVGGHLPTVFSGYAGTLDRSGQATASIRLPNTPALRGVSIYTAFVTHRAGLESISNTHGFMVQ